MKELINANDILTISKLERETEDFIKFLDVDDKTLKAYRVGIKAFTNYLKENDIKQPTRMSVIAFRDYLRDTYTSSTVNMYMASIRALFRYLSINKLYDNITESIKGAKYTNVPKKQVLSQEKASEIYRQLNDPREKCLFSLCITTGLRGIEIARANIEDIKMHNGECVLYVQCKKHDSKDEYVKLSDKVVNDIKEYIGNRTSGSIFISKSNHNKNGGVTTKTLRLEVKNIFKRFGLDDDTFSLHSLRRSSGTIAYLNGSSIYDIQQYLHHKSINTTQRYINVATRDNNKSEINISNCILGG